MVNPGLVARPASSASHLAHWRHLETIKDNNDNTTMHLRLTFTEPLLHTQCVILSNLPIQLGKLFPFYRF